MQPLLGYQLLLCLALSHALQARADEERPAVTLGGFGTLGSTYHTADGLEYRRSADQKHGTRANQLYFGTDSVVGAQLNAHVSEQFDGMLQAVSRQNPDSSWKPRLTWAFARYAPSEDWQLRVGRIGLETQLYSDSRAIGYSYTTVRPRPEVFGTIAFDYFDGLDANYRQLIGENLLNVKLFYGYLNGELPSQNGSPTKFGTTSAVGLITSVTRGDLQLRAAAGHTKSFGNGDIQPMIDALRAVGANDAAHQMDNDGRTSVFGEIDAVYEHGPYSLEFSSLTIRTSRDSALLANSSANAMLGSYRIARFKPYIGLARFHAQTANIATTLPPYATLLPLSQALQHLNANSERGQDALTLGVRYDFASNMALKFQLDQVRAKRSMLISNDDPADDRYRSLTLLSVALDFVF